MDVINKKYRLCVCPSCGHKQVTTARKKFLCRRCRTSRVFYNNKNVAGSMVKILCGSDLKEVCVEVLKSLREKKNDIR